MATVKTAISLPRDLFERAEALAHKMPVSQSRLFALAVEAFIQNHENQQLLNELNAAYGDAPDATEQMILERTRQQHQQILKAQR